MKVPVLLAFALISLTTSCVKADDPQAQPTRDGAAINNAPDDRQSQHTTPVKKKPAGEPMPELQ